MWLLIVLWLMLYVSVGSWVVKVRISRSYCRMGSRSSRMIFWVSRICRVRSCSRVSRILVRVSCSWVSRGSLGWVMIRIC